MLIETRNIFSICKIGKDKKIIPIFGKGAGKQAPLYAG